MPEAPVVATPEAPVQPHLFIDQNGHVVPLDPNLEQEALGSGYTPASPQQIEDYQHQQALHEKYGGTSGELTTFAQGVLRALSFGLSDKVVPEAEEYKTENPAASLTGEVAGMVAPLVLPGGQFTAPGAISGLGRMVKAKALLSGEKALELAETAKGAGGLTYDIVARTAPKAGYAYSAGKATEEALGAGKFTAQEIARFAERHVDDLAKPGRYLGAWLDPATQAAELNVTRVAGEAPAAMQAAKGAAQKAIFDLGAGRTIMTGADVAGLPAVQAGRPLAPMVRAALAQGAGSAVESAAYGLGYVVSEKALGDPNMTAQQAIADVGIAGALGLAGGTFGSLAWNISKHGFEKSGVGARVRGWLGEIEADNALRAAGGGKGMGKVVKAREMIGPEEVNSIAREGADLGFGSKYMTPKAVYGEATRAVEAANSQQETAILRAMQVMKPEENPSFRALYRELNENVVNDLRANPLTRNMGKALRADLDVFKGKYAQDFNIGDLLDMHRYYDDALGGALPAGTSRGVKTMAYHHIRTELESAIDKTMAGISDLPPDVYDAWKTSRRTGYVSRFFRDLSGYSMNRAATGPLVGLGDEVVGSAGAVAGAMHGAAHDLGAAAVGAGMHSVMGHGLGALAHPYAILGGAAGIMGRHTLRRYGPAILARGARALEGGVGGIPGDVFVGPAVALGEGYAEGGEVGEGDPVAPPKYQADLIRGAGQDGVLRKLVDTTHAAVAEENRLAQVHGQDPNNLHAHSWSETSEPVEQSPERIGLLADFERRNQAVTHKIDVHAGAAVRGQEAPPLVLGSQPDDHDRAVSTYEKRAQHVMRLASDPHALLGLLEDQTAHWQEHAPETAQALNMTTVKAVQYLSSLVSLTTVHAPLADRWVPSQEQIATFTRAWDALQNPTSILRQATAGTLTPDSVAAIDHVLPVVMEKMRTAIAQKITEHPNVPVRQRAMISGLMGQDMDGSQNPNLINANRAMYQRPQQMGNQALQQSQTRRPSSGGAKIGAAERMKTPTQAAADRASEKEA